MKWLFMCLAMPLAVASIAGVLIGSQAVASRALTEEEIAGIWGSACYDCDGVDERNDCNQPGCGGCVNGSVCFPAWKGTKNSRDVCVTDETPDGLCQEDDDVECYTVYSCNTDGSTQSNMQCSSVSGNCISGTGTCTECVQGAKGGTYDTKTYSCYKPQ